MGCGFLVIIIVYLVKKCTKKKLDVTHEHQLVITTMTSMRKFENPQIKARNYAASLQVKRPLSEGVTRPLSVYSGQYIPVESDIYSNLVNTDKLYHLGPAYPMYFSMLRRLIYSMLFLSFFIALPLLVQSSFIFIEVQDQLADL